MRYAVIIRKARENHSASVPVADEFELDEVIATERQLLYVAATRARDRLFLSGIAPGSEFIEDLLQASD